MTARSWNSLMCSRGCFHGKPYTFLLFHQRRTERAARQRAGVLQRTQTPHLAPCLILPSKHLLDGVDSWVCYDLVSPQREIVDKRDNRLMNRWHLVAVEEYKV